MSDVQKFHEHVEKHPEVRSKLESKTNKAEFLKEAVKLGKEHGYNFSEDDISKYIDSGAVPGRLSSGQLQSSGGGHPESYTYSKPGCLRH